MATVTLASMRAGRASLSSLESSTYDGEWSNLNEDNLLHEQLDEEFDGPPTEGNRRDLTDDLEDIARMPIDPSLRSRRSRVNVAGSFAPQPVKPQPMPIAQRNNHPHSSSNQLNNSTNSRPPSGSPSNARSGAPPSRIPGRSRSKSGGRELRTPHSSNETNEEEKIEWETLQVGTTPTPKSTGLPERRPTNGPTAKARAASQPTTKAFPTSAPARAPSPSTARNKSTPQRTAPSATARRSPSPTTLKTSTSSPRPRAKTQNWMATARPSEATQINKKIDLESAPNTLQIDHSPTSNGMMRSRTLGESTASARGKPSGGSKAPLKPRQRSFSTGRALDNHLDPKPLPPWAASSAPLLFRSDETGRLETSGNADNRVLPTVARRLEAERLAKLEEMGLIGEWDRNGMPSGAVAYLKERETPSRVTSQISTEPATSAESASGLVDEASPPASNARARPTRLSSLGHPHGAQTNSVAVNLPKREQEELPAPDGHKAELPFAAFAPKAAQRAQVAPDEREGDAHGGGCCGGCLVS